MRSISESMDTLTVGTAALASMEGALAPLGRELSGLYGANTVTIWGRRSYFRVKEVVILGKGDRNLGKAVGIWGEGGPNLG